jgi:osmotically inducible protein OsmC
MNDLNFDVQLRWSGAGRDGIGEIHAEDVTIDLATPESMGGRGGGSNPEELLVSAVASCYSATLFAGLRRARLPVGSLAVHASGRVSGFPGQARFDRLAVSPTILGGDPSRQAGYDRAAAAAHRRCLIGRALAPEVDYRVGPVEIRSEETPTPNGAGRAAGYNDEFAARDEADARVPAWRSGNSVCCESEEQLRRRCG